MCGIFGVINFDGQPVDKQKVLSARDILAHRGPDDSGFYESCTHASMQVVLAKSDLSGEAGPSVVLAHRRLSIIDLSPAAHQPMVSDDSRFVIVFNGEIFNYEEIKAQVDNRQSAVGNKFKTNSDTEVILKLYEMEGAECVNKLRGMFAFAIWDDKEKKLFAARDRFGIKPFYYLHNEKEFIFSSELKAIKHYKNGLTLSMQGMDAFLKTGSVPAPLTIYEETQALLPGHCLTIKNEKLEIKTYWTFFDLLNNQFDPVIPAESGIIRDTDDRFQTRLHSVSPKQASWNDKTSRNDRTLKYDDNAKKIIRNSLLDTIKAHMVADVEVGAFLSGGIDSTAIVSLMRQTGHKKIKTISVTFPGNKLDESKYSNLAAKKYETDHFEYRLEERELIDDFEKIIESMDQPTLDGINTYFVSKAAASFGLKVVLSGLGGDELFGGYPSFVNIPRYQKIKSLPFARQLMKAASVLAQKQLPSKAIEYFKNPDAPNAEYKLIRGLFTDSELIALGWSPDSRSTLAADRRTSFAGMTEAGMPSFRLRSESDGILGSDSRQAGMTDYFNQSLWRSPESNIQHPKSGNQHPSALQYVSMMESCVYMRNQLLRDSDVFSMTHSLELRVPFVDHFLYAAVLRYLDSGFDKSFPKKKLVDAVGDLPNDIAHRRKQGFTFPFEDWMRNGKIKNSINDSLTSSKMKDYFNSKALVNLQKDFEKNKIHWSRVWTFYTLSKFRT
jgi:asparagine synthase (glutamine-hydrolysing)